MAGLKAHSRGIFSHFNPQENKGQKMGLSFAFWYPLESSLLCPQKSWQSTQMASSLAKPAISHFSPSLSKLTCIRAFGP